MPIRKTAEQFIVEANTRHDDRYEYPDVFYINQTTPVNITCKKHGVFSQTPKIHLTSNGCPKCGRESVGIKNGDDKESFLKKVNKVHGYEYDYSDSIYSGTLGIMKIRCKKHGIFKMTAVAHAQGRKCQKCSREIKTENLRDTAETFNEKAIKVHGYLYEYPLDDYISSRVAIKIGCKKHGIFLQLPNNHLMGSHCPKCKNKISKPEAEIFEFISSYVEAKQNDRKILKGLELDILIPTLKIAFEFNGLYFHSDRVKEDTYHKAKSELCKDKGVKLYHIFEDEWLHKKDIVKSKILNILGRTENKVYARKCEIKMVSSKDSTKFLKENHLQGSVNSKIKIGLYYKDELVSLMTLGALRKNLGRKSEEGSYEMVRFCNKLNTSVIGAASKLQKYFESSYKPKQIISYADLRWSDGKLYHTLNYELSHTTKPNYFYVIGNKRENRFNYRKSILVDKGYDSNLTEKQIMRNLGNYRIYDVGSLCFIKKFNN